MRIAAFVVGIISGTLGLLSALFDMYAPIALLIVEGQFDRGEWEVTILIVLMGIFCLLAIAGAILALYRPRAGSLLLAISTVGLAVSVLSQPMWPGERPLNTLTFPIVFAPLFLLSAALAFFGRATPHQRSGGEEYRQQ